MKKQNLSKLLAFLVMVPAVSFAGLISVNYVAGTVYNTTDLTGYQTSGDDMDGMLVKAIFSNGSSETETWADITANSGGVNGTGWSLGLSGDSFTNSWTLISETALINNLLILAGPGNTMFDVLGTVGTINSANGWEFSQTSLASDVDYTATYSNILGVGGDAPVGDLYLNLELDFASAFVGNTLRFRADTDNALYAGDIAPSVPEPTTISFLSIGLLSMLGLVRRRKNN